MDIFTKEERSALMSKIRGKDTGIERMFLAELKRRKIGGFRRYGKLKGKPDFVFYKKKVAVFCDGDFWHGYRFGSQKAKLTPFWRNKIGNNINRDRKIRVLLEKDGWTVVRFWGHDIMNNPSRCVDKLLKIM